MWQPQSQARPGGARAEPLLPGLLQLPACQQIPELIWAAILSCPVPGVVWWDWWEGPLPMAGWGTGL